MNQIERERLKLRLRVTIIALVILAGSIGVVGWIATIWYRALPSLW